VVAVYHMMCMVTWTHVPCCRYHKALRHLQEPGLPCTPAHRLAALCSLSAQPSRHVTRCVRCRADLDREILALKREEQKLVAEIKLAAKQGNQAALKVLAKSLVRVRGQITKLVGSQAQLRGVSTQMTVSEAQGHAGGGTPGWPAGAPHAQLLLAGWQAHGCTQQENHSRRRCSPCSPGATACMPACLLPASIPPPGPISRATTVHHRTPRHPCTLHTCCTIPYQHQHQHIRCLLLPPPHRPPPPPAPWPPRWPAPPRPWAPCRRSSTRSRWLPRCSSLQRRMQRWR
jgi:hypothetical protein